ncbi:MAG: CCA tRNA nucleotidyltransferase [Rhodospirillales bacterium]|nr:CCA tRNA nucleotidyltransferase [Rhodospirillales bacterium]
MVPPADTGDRLADGRWMEAPETRAVVAALAADGGRVRFVGGCVRDAILGRPIKDIDLATPDPPETVMRRLETAGIRAIPTGIAHGTVTAVVNGKHFEITTLRHDVETFGRRARVAFTDDWTADAARRDFTVNAISADPDGALHDPFNGRDDLAAGRIRFVGDAETRIREDVLRLLRFFRFQAWYGRGAPDAAALAAARKLAHLVPGLSGERVAGEMFKLVLAPDPAAALRLMAADGVLRHALPEATNIARLAALAGIDREGGRPDALRRLAALLPRDAGMAAALAGRLRLSNADRDRLMQLAVPAAAVYPGLDTRARRRALHRLGADIFRDLAFLAWAGRAAGGDLAPADADAFRALIAMAAAWVPPVFPIKGRDALALGVPAGPRVGRLVAAVEGWWAENDFRPDRAACLAWLRALAGGE